MTRQAKAAQLVRALERAYLLACDLSAGVCCADAGKIERALRVTGDGYGDEGWFARSPLGRAMRLAGQTDRARRIIDLVAKGRRLSEALKLVRA